MAGKPFQISFAIWKLIYIYNYLIEKVIYKPWRIIIQFEITGYYGPVSDF